jgi:hypothetical protein
MHADVKATKPVLFVRVKPQLIEWIDKEVIKRNTTKAALLEDILAHARNGKPFEKFSKRKLM